MKVLVQRCMDVVQGRDWLVLGNIIVFQAEVYVMKACEIKNLNRGYKIGKNYILSVKLC
jgi:hypothetical protein